MYDTEEGVLDGGYGVETAAIAQGLRRGERVRGIREHYPFNSVGY
jgi:hypothetical protein